MPFHSALYASNAAPAAGVALFCKAAASSSSRRRGAATRLASLPPLLSAGGGGTSAGVGAAVGCALLQPPSTSSRAAEIVAAERPTPRVRPRSTTHAAASSSTIWAMVVGHVGYTPTASTVGRKLAVPVGIKPATCKA